MTPDLPTLIAELEEAERAATPGPWSVVNGCIGAMIDGRYEWSDVANVNAVDRDHEHEAEANARLIALMRNSLPALLEAVEAAQDMWRLTLLIETGVREMEGAYSANYEKTMAAIKRLRAALKETTDV